MKPSDSSCGKRVFRSKFYHKKDFISHIYLKWQVINYNFFENSLILA